MFHPDKQILIEIVKTRMPFGKYKDSLLCDLPVSYLEWFQRKGGFPPGKLGMQLATVFEIKSNGLEEIIYKLKKMNLRG
ncbi:DUF3820 family protein [Lacihabitans lacunae]|jgi:uncharacterized protein|uniref:DUF3820 family protein n=1 Tax=Lacihabitans lacunae TaxID=1028214 RepID=A0ABV7YTI4_9BACT